MTSAVTIQSPTAGQQGRVELSVIVPTFNERPNIDLLIAGLSRALAGTAWEVIIVDDNSPDGTWVAAKAAGSHDGRVRCIRRIGRRGLAGACLEGMLSSSSPFLAVMDGDLQHDESILPAMLQACRTGADLAIGTRVAGVADPEAMSFLRWRISRLGRALVRWALRRDLTDPLSGYFMIRRSVIEEAAPRLSTGGFKILADIVLTIQAPLTTAEVPYAFRPRADGASKFDLSVALRFVGLITHKLSRGLIPASFVLFGLIGALGVVVHLTVLQIGLLALKGQFALAQVIATYVAMTSNFVLDNRITFRERRHRGSRLAPAFLVFCLVCSVGVIANANVAVWIFDGRFTWWIAGLAGALVSAVWNYAASQAFVWPKRQ